MEPFDFREVILVQGQLKLEIEKQSILKHPFYQLWSEGKLSLEALRVYAKQYYHFVERFPNFLETMLANCVNPVTQDMISENLREERKHPVLWLAFANSLGLTDEDVVSSQMLPETTESIQTYERFMNESTPKAAAALLSYEAQVPEVAKRKMEGLEKLYGIRTAEALEYFRVHTTVDLEHVKVWEKVLSEEPLAGEVVEAIRRSLTAQWRLLDGVLKACRLEGLCDAPTMN